MWSLYGDDGSGYYERLAAMLDYCGVLILCETSPYDGIYQLCKEISSTTNGTSYHVRWHEYRDWILTVGQTVRMLLRLHVCGPLRNWASRLDKTRW